MATQRRLSAPTAPSWRPPPSASNPCSPDATLVGTSPAVPRSKTSPISPDLFRRAEKMARMTNELRLHKLITKTNSLERDVAQLMAQTKDNDVFCRQHAGRLEKVWHEAQAARARAESSCQLRGEDKLDMNEYKREVVQVKVEMANMRSVVEELMDKVGRLPTLAEANAVLAAVRTRREAWETAPGAGDDDDIRARIEETIRSTRRWHLDHKMTTLTDADFIARYLKKQSRRDPAMAAYLQRAIWRRVRTRAAPRDMCPRRPASLAEFCRHASWEDVKRAVEDVLVKRVYGAGAESLSQMAP